MFGNGGQMMNGGNNEALDNSLIGLDGGNMMG